MPPPPPPPGPPPPPVCNLEPVQLNKKEVEGRNLLLSSIRQGTKLKKAQTNDRSAPLIDGKKSSSNGSGDFSRTNGAPPGIGGLFAGGIPRLKSTTRSNIEGTSNQGALLPPNKKTVAPSPPVSRALFNNENTSPTPTSLHSSSISTSVPQTCVKRPFPNDRGPAPQPPPASNKPNFSGSSASTLPRPRTGPPLPNKPPVQGNKPLLQPRPPPGIKPIPPAKNLANSNSQLIPPHPSNLRRPSSLGEHDFRNNKFAIGGISSAGSVPKLNGSPATTPPGGPPPTRNLTTTTNINNLHPKQMAPPPPLPSNPPVTGIQRAQAPAPPERILPPGKPPGFRPPAPPSRPPNIASSLPHPVVPNMAPPPPPHQGPSMSVNTALPPPPPPHRTASAAQTRVANNSASNTLPPPPPTRHASVRNTSYVPFKQPDDFESRFLSKFKGINELPPPEPFKNSPKTYPTKQENQNAVNNQRRQPPPPPPPQQPQLQMSSNFYRRQETNC